AMNRRRKRGDNDARPGFRENLFKGRNYRAFRRGSSRDRRVGGIRKQREHAFLPVTPEGSEIYCLADDRRLVNLVVARVNDGAHRRLDSEMKTVNQTVRGANELDGK